jgi:cytochrome c peroxidase
MSRTQSGLNRKALRHAGPWITRNARTSLRPGQGGCTLGVCAMAIAISLATGPLANGQKSKNDNRDRTRVHHTHDGSNSPHAKVSAVEASRKASSIPKAQQHAGPSPTSKARTSPHPGQGGRTRGVRTEVAAPSLASGPLASGQQSQIDTRDPFGVLRTIAIDDSDLLDSSNPFFQSLGTNGRSCSSCHVASSAWTITPVEVQQRFAATKGLDPIFRTVDGSNSPNADVSTVQARREAFSMLLNKGVIRIGLAIPDGAEFALVHVDDPYRFASASELSLFRRPLPATNLRFLTAVMWDGRESFAPRGTTPISADATPERNAVVLFNDLMHQANDATLTHAQAAVPLTDEQAQAIVQFVLNRATAQQKLQGAGDVDASGAQGGPAYVATQPFYVTINDVLGADKSGAPFDKNSMTLFQAWTGSRDKERAAVARGAKLFGTKPIHIRGVRGLNDALGMPTIKGTCTTCHDAPNIGNHSVALPLDIGVTDASRRTPDMPLYTLQNLQTGEIRQTTDPGRALLTGLWKDIAKFKGPILRGLAARPPYFHNGLAADLRKAVEFYDTRFSIGFTDNEKADLVAFLSAL